ncbi:MAG: hypothetical protein HQL20_07675 [Candidatus Omnitrophica bacterium]|nr:hypothetical protein [Candidatus Omnitrophota bacterium]
MGFVKSIVLAFVIGGLAGCISTGTPLPSATYDEGYRQGVKENLGRMAEGLNGNGFPYLGGSNWAAPLVQETRIPAHVQGGVFYPEHNELVIITPGEWQKAGGFPLRSPGVIAAGTAEVLTADITALPSIIHTERQIK